MAEQEAFRGWWMVAIAFIVQNCAVVMATAAYGTALTTFQGDLGISRAFAAAAPGVMLLSLGVLSPFIGNLLQKVSLRNTMTVGALISVIGYAIVALAPNFTLVLLAYGLLIGPAACLMGPLAASTLVSRWFERDRGKALGLANMPFFMLFTPPLAALAIELGGRQLLFLIIAGVFMALVPLTRLVVDHPGEIGQAVRRNETEAALASAQGEPLSNRALLTDARFWLLSLGMGILTGAGTAFVTHATPIATSKGIDLTTAATLVSMFGFGTLFGAIFFGWLIDKIGALFALVCNAGMQVALWTGLLLLADLTGLLAVSAFIGMGMGASVALHGAAINEIFGPPSFSRAMGQSYFLKVPFLFGAAPLLGHFFDQTGNYELALLTSASGLGVAMALFLFMAVFMQGKRREPQPAY